MDPMIDFCRTLDTSTTKILIKLKNTLNLETQAGTQVLVQKGTWMVVHTFEEDSAICINASSSYKVPLDALEIPESWFCRECERQNDNFTELSTCWHCDSPPYGRPNTTRYVFTGSTLPPISILRLMSSLTNGTSNFEDILHQSLVEAQENGTNKTSEEDKIPENEIPNEGDIVCNICVERKGTLYLTCCGESGKNLCKSCLKKLYTKTETDQCPYCRKTIDFETHKKKDSPIGDVI